MHDDVRPNVSVYREAILKRLAGMDVVLYINSETILSTSSNDAKVSLSRRLSVIKVHNFILFNVLVVIVVALGLLVVFSSNISDTSSSGGNRFSIPFETIIFLGLEGNDRTSIRPKD